MTTRQRAVLSLSLPPTMAKEYRDYARSRGVSASEVFREMFVAHRREELKKRLGDLQQYGAQQAARRGITEADIERLVFGER